MLIVATKSGQLGNRLILGAHLIALASEFGWRLAYPAFDDYAAYFQGPCDHRMGFAKNLEDWTAPWPASSFLLTHLSARLIRKARLGNRLVDVLLVSGGLPSDDIDLAQPEFRRRIDAARVILLLGWRIRNYPLVAKHQDAIRAYFQPIEPIRRRVTELLVSVRAASRPLVGVHIRQGDYRNFLGGKHFLETSRYIQYMKRLRELLDRPAFLICSSEPQQRELFAEFDVVRGPGHMVEDLHALSQCDFILGVPSTFCRWAAFYGRRPLFLIEQIEPEALLLEHFTPQGDYV